MGNEIANKAFEYIDAIAAKMGVAAEHVYGILIKQKFAQGIADTVLGSVLLIVLFSLTYLLIAAYTKDEWAGERYSREPANKYAKLRELISDSDGIILIPIIIVMVFSSIIGSIFLYLGVLAIINPEYYAIKEILEALGGGK